LLETTILEDGAWRQETHFLVSNGASSIEHLVEVARMGAHTRADHEVALAAAGLSARFEPVGLLGRGLFVAVLERRSG
jgi:hypothetical protein